MISYSFYFVNYSALLLLLLLEYWQVSGGSCRYNLVNMKLTGVFLVSVLMIGIQRTDVMGEKTAVENGENEPMDEELLLHTLYGKDWSKKKRAMPVKGTPGHFRWPNATIPYAIDPQDFSPEEISLIVAAMREYEKYTCVIFKYRFATDMVKIVDSEQGCHSRLGMTGGSQFLGLGKGCRTKHTVLHALGHVIGLIHEHQRPDRDQYVTVNSHNVRVSAMSMFSKHRPSGVEDLGVPYGYQSIMQYGDTFHSSNGGKTLVPKDKNQVLGQDVSNPYLTFYDVMAVNLMYKCGANCPNTCPEGILGKDCKCFCKPDSNEETYKECGNQY